MDHHEDLSDLYGGADDDAGADEISIYTRISLPELVDKCILPTLQQASTHIVPSVVLATLCKFISHTVGEGFEVTGLSFLPRQMIHLTSAFMGALLLHLFFQEQIVFVATLAALSYLVLLTTKSAMPRYCGTATAAAVVAFLLVCELFVVSSADWHRIRGAQMILAMKVISIGFDVDRGVLIKVPGISEFVGYAFNVGTVIFGPWISFLDYMTILQLRERKMSFYWIFKMIRSFVASMLCIITSTCVVHWVIIEGSWKWLIAFRDAQSFRFSHYFVSYLSELTITSVGLGAMRSSNGDVKWDFSVARPTEIEFPRSLVEVVTNWNVPMHHWLKTYVFKTARALGTFVAVLLTYAASAILHGLNFQLGAVLLSLGFYSYVEYVLRARLSTIFSACVGAKRCRGDCAHDYKSNSPYVIFTNAMFGCLSVFHLAYLGLMFDSSSQQEKGYTMSHTLSKWSELNYASHWVALVSYVFYLLV
ncbi:protein-serine O-palmitoleoyltransferase porcupine-like [Tubulanus polymorphus]|uniref:protein-serine O-palmitoleoyltransferase porcupine-like n=1 Tax=Tubulanus polymorphus TaxID=672921 RepID=UPI003DA2CEEF